MPRNGSGTFSLSDTLVPNTRASATQVNAILQDIANGLTDSIATNGVTSTDDTIPFDFGISLSDGAAATPSLCFTSDTNTGLFRIGVDDIGVSVGGTQIESISADGFDLSPPTCGVDAKALLLPGDTTGGYFSDYDCKATWKLVYENDEDQSVLVGNGSFRDGLFIQQLDTDSRNYTAVGQRVSHGIRAYTTGDNDGVNWVSQYKDLVGGSFVAQGKISWSARGVTSVLGEAIQFGTGIATGAEFLSSNPAASPDQSTSMASVQAIISGKKAAANDSTHFSRGFLTNNLGKKATAAFEALSAGTGGDDGTFMYGLRLVGATVTDAAIQMPQSASGVAGTLIVYDPNDYTSYDRTGNTYSWVIGGTVAASLASNGINIPTGSFYQVNATQVVAARRTGWTAATGTANRTSFNTGTVTTAELADRVKALLDDLLAHGLIGA